MAITLPELPFIPNLPISPLAVIHLIFTGLALLYDWLPLTYFFVHLVLILILLWAAHDKESAVSVIIYLVALAYSFITDLIGLGYYFGRKDTSLLHSEYRPLWQFTAAMAIIHLLIKPMMGIFGLLVVVARRASLRFSLKDESHDGYSNLESGGGGGQ